jgi:mannose-1-phosphate guanylyltransferase
MNYAIILAGGTGSRFWPLSRTSEPKQFLHLYSDKAILEETICRASSLLSKENIYIAANIKHKQNIKNIIKHSGILPNNVFLEPSAKNTLAPILALSKRIYYVDKDAIIAILPSDHLVTNKNRFMQLLAKGFDIAGGDVIVTFGVSPKRPETGYGYIRVKNVSKRAKFYKVDKFIEKPEFKTANKLIKDKSYYWNSGMFIFRARVLLEEAKRLVPSTFKIIMKSGAGNNVPSLWGRLSAKSIDYAIMEKSKRIVLLPADCGWLDLGSWGAIEEMTKKDKNGNIFKGQCIDIGSKNIIVQSDNRLVATLGLNDIIIVDTKDALLVCRKDKAQEVKKIRSLLKLRNFKKYI